MLGDVSSMRRRSLCHRASHQKELQNLWRYNLVVQVGKVVLNVIVLISWHQPLGEKDLAGLNHVLDTHTLICFLSKDLKINSIQIYTTTRYSTFQSGN